MTSNNKKRILITAARSPLALDLARKLRSSDHEIFVTDTTRLHVCQFSNAVKKSFSVSGPRDQPQAFIDSLINIVEQEKIDLVIPIYEEILYLSRERHRFPKSCQIFSQSFEVLNQLHNKWLFYSKLREMKIDAPETFLVKTTGDLEKIHFSKPYVLKASYSRASLNIKKILPNEPLPSLSIEPHNPWIAQEWLEGTNYCSYSICHNGSIKAHSTYPVKFAIDGNSCITFESIDHPEIFKWIEHFVREINFTGQIAFDFIELPNKQLFAIECNPRATSGLHLFDDDDQIDKAFLNMTTSPILPKKGSTKQIATGMMMYGWKKSSHPQNTLKRFFKTLLNTRDVIFRFNDLMPFLMMPLVFIGLWMKSKKSRLSIPAAFVSDNEWNGNMNDGEPK